MNDNRTQDRTTDDLRRPALERGIAMRLAATEYTRMAATLEALEPTDWARPTDCSAWDVRDLAAHMVGMAAMAATPWETARQQRKSVRDAREAGTDVLTALTALQVSERAGRSPDQIVAEARRIGPRAARGRRLTPGIVRRRPLSIPQDVGGRLERWSLGYLIDVILTRDPWMHRMDLARATGRDPLLTADHDAVIVADVVAEWAGRHGSAYDLELTGAAGGRWRHGTGGERIVLDAIDFCRVLSGRGQAPSLLAVAVPF